MREKKREFSSIVSEVNKTVFFFFTQHILNLKYAKQKHLTNNQLNISYKQKNTN